MSERVVVIGAGSSGLFTSIELAVRGFDVALIEKGTAGSGTSGRFHGLLHSGARYAVTDRKAAEDCYSESRRIIKIAPHCVEQTGGLFVSMQKADEGYGEQLAEGLKNSSIPFSEISGEEALAREPNLSEEVTSAIAVEDAVLKGSLFLLSALMTAMTMGVRFLPSRELSGVETDSKAIKAVRLLNLANGRAEREEADFVVNCSGPWISETSRKLGVNVEMLPTAGVMSVVGKRLILGVINRMRKPSDGDILVPYGSSTIAGTTAAVTEDPASFEINEEDVEMLLEEAAVMVPLVAKYGFQRSYASFRPLLKTATSRDGRQNTRDFSIVTDSSKVKNLACVVGGKMTTSRLTGEKAAETTASAIDGRSAKSEEYKLLSPFEEANWGGLIDEKDISLLSSWKRTGGGDYEASLTSTLLERITRKNI